jgi:putative hydrolase of the HAD superfamily
MKAVIFDLNGVFIQSPKLSERFQTTFGVPAEKFVDALRNVMAVARLPNARDSFRLWKPYLDAWGLTKMDSAMFFDFWFSAEREVPEMIAIAEQAKADGTEIFILSNNFKERTEFYARRFGFLKTLPKKVYYSWQTGFVKPEPKAYALVLAENGLKGEDVAYFDDSEKNIQSAATLQIQGHIFKNPQQVRSILSGF